MNKPKLNVPLLRKVQKHILAEPRRFEMGDFAKDVSYLDDLDFEHGKPPCGTQACVAGWGVILGKKIKNLLPFVRRHETDSDFYFNNGRRLFGLTREEAARLFVTETDIGGTKQAARIKSNEIDQLIKNREKYMPDFDEEHQKFTGFDFL